jgi:GT2 family glycosyltransferase
VALIYLERLRSQTRPPDVVVVVDNGSDERLRSQIQAMEFDATEIRYLDPGRNIGPAGAFDVGFRELITLLCPDDLVVHLDDDDPPVSDEQLAELVEEFNRVAVDDPHLGGIGLSGGRLNVHTGLVSAVSGSGRLEHVDHLHGGYLPVYLAKALLDVDGNDPTFFYGFEELELGRRLHLRGWHLLVHNELMGRYRDRYPKRSLGGGSRLAVNDADNGWSRFHKERNLIRILRRERRWAALAVTILGRQIAKPLLAIVRQPRAATRRLGLGLRASVMGLLDRGGIDSYYSPPRSTATQ